MRLRVAVTVDGVALPDAYFDHPAFTGTNASVTVYADNSPTNGGVTDQYVQAGAPVALSKNAGVQSPNDSRNKANYAVP